MIRSLLAPTLTLLLVGPAVGESPSQTIPVHPRNLEFDAEEPKLPRAEGRRFQLAAGPVVYLVEDRTLPLVEIGLASRAGSFLDPPDRAGLASLTASQLRRGGSGLLEPDAFDNRVDELGARMDTRAGGARAGATLSVPTWAFAESLDLFFDMIANPRFDPARLDNARRSLLEGLKRRNENPLEVLEREWSWLLYGRKHFTTRLWTPSTLNAIDREGLFDFHRRHWHPQQMILAVSGDVGADELMPVLESKFAAWTNEGAETAPWPPPMPASSADAGLYHYEFDAPQAKIVIGHRFETHLDWQHRDRFVLAVVAEILGGQGAISRVGGRLRTGEGLVYRVVLNLIPGDLWPGEMRLFFETRSDSAAKAVQAAVEEIERLRREPPHPSELAVAKRSLITRMSLQFDTAEEIAGYFAGDELIGRPHSYWQTYLDSVADVSAEEVRDVAARYIRPEGLLCLVVGRWQEIGGGTESGQSALEKGFGARVVNLPQRDPSTLESAEPTPAPHIEPTG